MKFLKVFSFFKFDLNFFRTFVNHNFSKNKLSITKTKLAQKFFFDIFQMTNTLIS